MSKPDTDVEILAQSLVDIMEEAGKPRKRLADDDPTLTRISVGTVYSNQEKVIDKEVAEKLKTIHSSYAEHVAWDFWASIHYDPATNEFISYVKQYQEKIGGFHHELLEEVIRLNTELGGTD